MKKIILSCACAMLLAFPMEAQKKAQFHSTPMNGTLAKSMQPKGLYATLLR